VVGLVLEGGGVFHDYAGWLLLAWFALTWVVSAFFGFITLEFFERTAGYVVLLSALTSTALLVISKIFTRRRKTVDQLIKEALEKR
jgi:purine-cytosine permease-like protein